MVRGVIVWVNGTFGAGKTTVSRLVAERVPGLRLFDPEYVGYLLRANLSDHPVRDFRDWESWRVLTPVVADELGRFTGQGLVAPQTVLEEDYWDELVRGLSDRGHDVLHVLLEADEATMRARIEADAEEAKARTWRLAHLSTYAEARTWMVRRADLVVDTTDLTAVQVADRVCAAVRSRADL
jgi:predicted kinase